jgi:phosphoribosylanthranilate isomerase
MTQRTRIKICGLTREADVDCAVQCGADALGFNFYAKSARHVSVARAVELAQRLPPFVTPVGLFVNAAAREVEDALRALPQLILQFHGDETPDDCRRWGRPYLRAARMREGFDLLDFCASHAGAQAVLLDTFAPGFGGSGKVFDWSLIPHSVPLPVVLSGGLHAANVAEGIARVRPWAVDVSSGVESAALGKGIKDAAAIRRFCETVREADARLAAP